MGLESIWFFIWGVLWALWLATDGFDLGAGILYPFIGRDEKEKSAVISSIAPLWDGNEVWLVAAGGATFAAFPPVYAGLFSFMYILFAVLLFSLILRGVSLEFIYEGKSALWLTTWGMIFFVGSITAPFVFGLIFGNVFQGLAFDGAGYRGGILTLINPYSILTGTVMVIICILHGSIWISMYSEGDLKKRAERMVIMTWFIALVLLAVFIVETPVFTSLHRNYTANPVLLIIPALMLACFICLRIFFARGRPGMSFIFSIATIMLLLTSALAGLYPDLLPSSIEKAASLSIYNSASGRNTLIIMTAVAAVLVPVVVASQAFVYWVFRFKGK
jgi:cytochrome bd ubiquinol oxidase subunit II